jgi:biopolymer transport protein TolR
VAFKDRSARAKARPVMNVTPLVDVVLVLLIIFMVVLPAMDEQVRLETPAVVTADEARPDGAEANAYTLAITANGTFYLDSQPIDGATLEGQLRGAHVRAPSKRLVLRGDRTLSYGMVRRIFATAQNIGFPGVLLRVNQRQDQTLVATGG